MWVGPHCLEMAPWNHEGTPPWASWSICVCTNQSSRGGSGGGSFLASVMASWGGRCHLGAQRGESQAWFAFHFCPVFAAHGASSFEKPSRLDRATGLNWLKFLGHLLCASALHTSFEIFSLFLYSYYAITANAGKFPL